ncbi:hypothetical protein SBA1_100091 [Candidatus Sulfotelmatobacter kueseliae]|uniref:Uncharacterized protein n=1 Tax=Candidatus Sulfotelmatobacter kueseliae TaxID=2042962 RepID=A0A2U3JWG8_9BACT|nr:hypothetical protein SBA1_100091 [Candidatus Sulfotelmatobacter kueseliae]
MTLERLRKFSVAVEQFRSCCAYVGTAALGCPAERSSALRIQLL